MPSFDLRKSKNKKRNQEEFALDTQVHEREGSLVRGWPALLLTVAMVAATVYAFAPEVPPHFPVTHTGPDKLLVNGLARQDGHYIVVGENGRIFTATNPDGPWKRAKVSPQREATLTRVQFIGKHTAIAVGHSSWILRSTDDGATWHEVNFDKSSSKPLLGVAGPIGGKLYAYGAYGLFMVSSDQGQHWQALQLKAAKSKKKAAAAKDDSKTNPSSPNYDPFAAFEAGQENPPLSNRHIYGMVQASDGSLFLVGESGLIAHSTDDGKTWHVQKSIYPGTFFGILKLPNGNLLIYGMDGHVYTSSDLGRHWQRSKVPVAQSLFGGRVTSDGRIVLVGADNTVLVSGDGGKTFMRDEPRGAPKLASVLALPDGSWLIAGTGGLVLDKPKQNSAAERGLS